MNMDEGCLHLLNSGSNPPNGNYWSTIPSFSQMGALEIDTPPKVTTFHDRDHDQNRIITD